MIVHSNDIDNVKGKETVVQIFSVHTTYRKDVFNSVLFLLFLRRIRLHTTNLSHSVRFL